VAYTINRFKTKLYVNVERRINFKSIYASRVSCKVNDKQYNILPGPYHVIRHVRRLVYESVFRDQIFSFRTLLVSIKQNKNQKTYSTFFKFPGRFIIRGEIIFKFTYSPEKHVLFNLLLLLILLL